MPAFDLDENHFMWAFQSVEMLLEQALYALPILGIDPALYLDGHGVILNVG